MSLWRELPNRISYLFRRGQFDWELDQELRFHIETRADELERAGLAREEALTRARREFGSGARMRERTREAWQFPWFEEFLGDLRHSARVLLRSPGFTAAAVFSLALGTGANTTVFSLVKAVLLGDLPVRNPEQLASFHQAGGAARLSYPDFEDYRKQVGSFEDIAASYPAVPGSFSAGDEPERIWGQLVTTNFFSVMGAEPNPGRGFLPEENSSARVVISNSLWKRKFGGDQAILGKTVRLRGRPYTVAGIAPAGFHGSLRGFAADFWIPLGLHAQTVPQIGQGATAPLERDRNYPWLFLTARLKQGVSKAGAQAELRTVESRLDQSFPKPSGRRELRLVPAISLAVGTDQARTLLGTLMAVVGLVLLAACANVANLLLARSMARNREIGVRLAIGAGRARLVRQLLTESLLLSIMGAFAGIALAWAGTRALAGLETSMPFPTALDLSIDWRVLLFTASLAVATGVIFGLAPAVKGTRLELTSLLKFDTTGSAPLHGFGWMNGLVVLQVSVSVVLLIAAGLFVRSLRTAKSIPLGMDARNVLVIGFDPRAAGYSDERAALLFPQLLDRVRALPDVDAAALVDRLPLSFVPSVVGVSRSAAAPVVLADIYGVTSGYFRTLGIGLIRGRDFDSRRRAGLPPAIINETLAARLYPGEDPIGRPVSWEGMPHQVIAIAGNAKSRTVAERPQSQIYVPVELEYQYFWGLSGVVLTVRTAGPPLGLVHPIRTILHDLGPALAVYRVGTMTQQVDSSLLIARVCGSLFGVFGAIALLLAAVGLYGIMSYSAERRTREIGIRVAIGARRVDVVRMLASQGLWLTALGIGFGLVLSYSVTRVVSAFLYGISPRDVATFAGVSLMLIATAVLAILVPALRAAGRDPLRSIRYE